MKAIALLFTALLLFLLAPCAIATTAEQLLSACRPVAAAEQMSDNRVQFLQTYQTGLCWGTFETIQKIIVHVDASKRPIYSVCAPATTTLT